MRIPRLLFVQVLCLTSAVALAADYNWPQRGKLSMESPGTWKVSTQSAAGLGFTFKVASTGENQAMLQMTVVALPEGKTISESDLPERLRTMVGRNLASSVEKKVNAVQLAMGQGAGWYAELTDASLVGKPSVKGDYKVMRQGVAALDSTTFVVITMQFDNADGSEPAKMVGMVESLRFARGAAEPAPVSLRIEETTDFYKLHDPDGRLVLKIPRGDLVVRRNANVGGATASPRYFNLAGSGSGLALSGWIEPASLYKGLQQFWKDETAAAAKARGLEPKSVKFSKHEDWDLIAYDLALPVKDVNNTHYRAELVRNGTWIDLHVSATGSRPISELRADLMAFMQSIEVETP